MGDFQTEMTQKLRAGGEEGKRLHGLDIMHAVSARPLAVSGKPDFLLAVCEARSMPGRAKLGE